MKPVCPLVNIAYVALFHSLSKMRCKRLMSQCFHTNTSWHSAWEHCTNFRYPLRVLLHCEIYHIEWKTRWILWSWSSIEFSRLTFRRLMPSWKLYAAPVVSQKFYCNNVILISNLIFENSVHKSFKNNFLCICGFFWLESHLKVSELDRFNGQSLAFKKKFCFYHLQFSTFFLIPRWQVR